MLLRQEVKHMAKNLFDDDHEDAAGDDAVVATIEPKRHPATAHFPGGCDGICNDCRHFESVAEKNAGRGRCLMWARFRGLIHRYSIEYRAEHPKWWRGLPTNLGGDSRVQIFRGQADRRRGGADPAGAGAPMVMADD
jgi:hypothetical protein